MEQETPIIRPIRVVQTVSTHDDELNYVGTVPSEVDINTYTDYLQKDLIEFLNKELYSL